MLEACVRALRREYNEELAGEEVLLDVRQAPGTTVSEHPLGSLASFASVTFTACNAGDNGF